MISPVIRVWCSYGLLALGVARAAVAQCADGSPPPCGRTRTTAAPLNSVAVLYFDNLSRDTSDAYLADGLTEELISRLSQVDRLQVKSRTAVQRFRGRRLVDPASVGRSLGVSHLVTGSVLRAGQRLRVTVELTGAARGVSAWSRTFDRSAVDLIGVESEIAESVAVGVGGRLAPADRRSLETRPTTNDAAYDHYLRGNFEMARRTPQALLRAAQEYEAAVRLDPRFVAPMVRAGSAYGLLGTIYYDPSLPLSRDTLRFLGQALIDRALRIDSTSAEGWTARGSDTTRTDAQRGEALANAARLSPHDPGPHHVYAIRMRDQGDDSTAVREFRIAIALDPERTISLENLGIVFEVGRNFGEARRWIDSAVALKPEASFYYLEQGFNRLARGDTAGARASGDQVAAHGNPNGREELLAIIEARSGDTAAAWARLAPIDSSLATANCRLSYPCLELDYALAATHDRDRALALFERLGPSEWMAYWNRRSEFDSIRDDPRFRRMLALPSRR